MLCTFLDLLYHGDDSRAIGSMALYSPSQFLTIFKCESVHLTAMTGLMTELN